MEAIKNSKIIIILLILYIGISILVITMDKKARKEKDDTTKVQITDKDFETFSTEVSSIRNKAVTYMNRANLAGDVCITINDMLNYDLSYEGANVSESDQVTNYVGSALIKKDKSSITLWYKSQDLDYVIDGVEVIGGSINRKDVSKEFSTKLYNNCAQEY